ncbi:hypothetical protein [Agreia sp. COWG]|uniref:hypothetical protein n=1 Tax=Agreia sp. COWG TaxID=2773266 RepID=UPI001926057F|nr:hypothetical protein [Agreia sp. COWG]CAD5990965.1 conserved protein of unknown function [Agreia sp. COWG]
MSNIKNLIVGDHRDPRDEIQEIFPAQATSSSEQVASEWARSVLESAEVEASNEVSAIAALRKAEPRLGLKSAVFITKTVNNS